MLFNGISLFKWLILFCSAFASALVSAQTENAMPSVSGMLLQVLGALLLVTSLIIGTAWIAKRLNVLNPINNNLLKPLASVNVGRKEKIVLVNACGKTLLLGVASGSVNFLCDLSDEETLNGDTEGNVPVGDFLQANQEENGIKNQPKREFSHFLKNILANSRRENNT